MESNINEVKELTEGANEGFSQKKVFVNLRLNS